MSADSTKESLCGVCGKPIPPWAPAGNCPGCLFGDGSKKTERAPGRSEEPPREMIGDWELQEKIGEGAFGVVFAAEQIRPVRRSAALKLLRPGMGSKQILARFEAESQALALMNHPDLVTIYDAGKTEDGRPYFVMEFVPGEAVTRFASSLSIEEKLALFDRICAVVEHAHGRGIIHRDLKPANILAYRNEDGEAVIKLLDFGIAKATEHVLTDATVLTGDGTFLGTPEYMSPEQTTESDIDIRADVYSLGVILFELLAGRPPFVLESHSLEAVMQFLDRVRHEDPPTLSRVTDPPLNTDLNWIIGKAIEKDRSRRYKTVGELRDDLRRYRNDEPVRARPPDTFYLARKFLRRNWKLTASLAAILLSFAGAAAISGFMAIRAREAASETRQAFSLSELRTANSRLGKGDISGAIAHLTQSLRTDPDNQEAAILLHTTLSQFPISTLLFETKLIDESLRVAYFTDSKGSSVVVSETGDLLFSGPKGKPRLPPLDASGTNQFSILSPDKSKLAVSNIQGEFLLIDLVEGRRLPLEQVPGVEGFRYSEIAFSLDGKRLCLGSNSGSLHFWDVETGDLLWNWKHDPGVRGLVITAYDSRIAIATRDSRIIELDAKTGAVAVEYDTTAEPVHDLVNSGSSHRYYTVSTSGVIAAVDAGRSPRTFTPERVDTPLLLSASDPDRLLVAYLGPEEASIWTVDGQTIISRLPLTSAPSGIEIHPDEAIAYVATRENGIHLWNFSENRLLGTEIARARNVEAMQIDPESNLLRTITRDGVLRLYQLPESAVNRLSASRKHQVPESWSELPIDSRNASFALSPDPPFSSLEEFPDFPPRTVGLSRDSSRLYAAYRDGFIRMWDTTSGKRLVELETTTKSVRCCDLSPDHQRLAFRDSFSSFAIHDLATGTSRKFPSFHQRDLSSIVFSPDGDTLAIATDDGTIDVVSVATGEALVPRMNHDVRGLVAPHYTEFSGDGSILASWGEPDRSFRFWDPATGGQKGGAILEEGIPRWGHFLDDQRYFAVVCEGPEEDLYLRIWSLEERVPVSPRRKIAIDTLHAVDLQLPKLLRYTEEELQGIETQNGLRIGRNGLSEIPLEELIDDPAF